MKETNNVKYKSYILVCILIIAISISGCSFLLKASPKTDTLVAGTEYGVDDLFSTDNEDVELSMDPQIVTPETLDSVKVTLSIKKGKFVKEKEYEFKVVDQTPPEISQTSADITEGESFEIKNFIEVSDNIDSSEAIAVNVTSGTVDTSKTGEYEVTVEVIDLSGNSTNDTLTFNVKPKQIELVKGKSYVSKYDNTEIKFTFNGVEYQDEVYTHSDNMFARYYSNQPDSQYLVVKLFVENRGGNNINYNNIEEPKLLVDNKYNYRLYQLDTTSSVCSSYWGLNPLKSQDVYLMYNVPNELLDKEFEISFTIGGIPYVYHGSKS